MSVQRMEMPPFPIESRFKFKCPCQEGSPGNGNGRGCEDRWGLGSGSCGNTVCRRSRRPLGVGIGQLRQLKFGPIRAAAKTSTHVARRATAAELARAMLVHREHLAMFQYPPLLPRPRRPRFFQGAHLDAGAQKRLRVRWVGWSNMDWAQRPRGHKIPV